jgi:hypothetical protein
MFAAFRLRNFAFPCPISNKVTEKQNTGKHNIIPYFTWVLNLVSYPDGRKYIERTWVNTEENISS